MIGICKYTFACTRTPKNIQTHIQYLVGYSFFFFRFHIFLGHSAENSVIKLDFFFYFVSTQNSLPSNSQIDLHGLLFSLQQKIQQVLWIITFHLTHVAQQPYQQTWRNISQHIAYSVNHPSKPPDMWERKQSPTIWQHWTWVTNRIQTWHSGITVLPADTSVGTWLCFRR